MQRLLYEMLNEELVDLAKNNGFQIILFNAMYSLYISSNICGQLVPAHDPIGNILKLSFSIPASLIASYQIGRRALRGFRHHNSGGKSRRIKLLSILLVQLAHQNYPQAIQLLNDIGIAKDELGFNTTAGVPVNSDDELIHLMQTLISKINFYPI
ncbi:hypothetical protein OAB57_03075 [Bacteriovoracaceae bacterium]|nr:hypothetical protein [Bacteriovoracaceae bacterium]